MKNQKRGIENRMKKMEISVKFIDNDGKTMVKTVSKRDVPYLKEMEEQGFEAAFNDLEKAVIEASKESREEAIEKYIEKTSKKKQNEKRKKAN